MAGEKEFFYPSSDGAHRCYAREWLPEGTPRAVVQIVHGVAEYVGRYAAFASWLAGKGFVVVGEDHLGHGKTADNEKFGYFGPKNGWELVVKDVRRLRELEGEKYPEIPYFILGHSMGSFLTRTYLIDYPGTVTGAILSGTGQESALTVGGGKLLCGLICLTKGPDAHSSLVHDMALGAYNRKFAPNRTSSDWISRDEKVVDRYLQDPLCTFMPTVGMYRDMMGGLQYIGSPKNLKKMYKTTPIYFFSGSRDPVGQDGRGVEKVADLFRAAGCTDVTVKLYPDGRHEMLNELNKMEVYQDILSWLEAKV